MSWINLGMTLNKSLILCPLRTYNSLSESWTGTSKVMPLPEAMENAQRFVLQTFSPVRHWLKITRLVATMSTCSILVIFGRVFPETPKDNCIVGRQLRRSSKIAYFISCDAGIRLFIYGCFGGRFLVCPAAFLQHWIWQFPTRKISSKNPFSKSNVAEIHLDFHHQIFLMSWLWLHVLGANWYIVCIWTCA